MATYARVVDNMVYEIFVEFGGFSIDECFHPILRAMFQEVPEGTVVNSVWDEQSQTWKLPPQQKATK